MDYYYKPTTKVAEKVNQAAPVEDIAAQVEQAIAGLQLLADDGNEDAKQAIEGLKLLLS